MPARRVRPNGRGRADHDDEVFAGRCIDEADRGVKWRAGGGCGRLLYGFLLRAGYADRLLRSPGRLLRVASNAFRELPQALGVSLHQLQFLLEVLLAPKRSQQ